MFKTYFFGIGFKSIRNRFTSWCLMGVVGVFFMQCTKEPKDPIASKKDALLKYAALNPEASVFWIDTTKSRVSWSGSTLEGHGITGTIIPVGGCLVEMEGEFSGGYLQLPISGMSLTPSDTFISKNEATKILLSSDFLNLAKNSLIDFEMKASLRYIERGDILSLADSRGFTHNITGNLTLNDSTRQVSFPIKSDTLAHHSRAVSGRFSFSYPEYGIQYGTIQDTLAKFKLNPNVDIEFNLYFKLFNAKD